MKASSQIVIGGGGGQKKKQSTGQTDRYESRMFSSGLNLYDGKDAPNTVKMDRETEDSQNRQTEIVSGHMFDTGKQSLESLRSQRIQVLSHVGSSPITEKGAAAEQQQQIVLTSGSDDVEEEIRTHRFGNSGAQQVQRSQNHCHQIVIKTVCSSNRNSFNPKEVQESAAGYQQDDVFLQHLEGEPPHSRESVDQAVVQLAKSKGSTSVKGNKISLKRYNYEAVTGASMGQQALTIESLPRKSGELAVSQRVYKKNAPQLLFTGASSATNMQATRRNQKSRSRESSSSDLQQIPFVQDCGDFEQTAAIYTSRDFNKSNQNRTVNFQPSDVKSEKRGATGGASKTSSVETGQATSARQPNSQRVKKRHQMNLQNKTQRIFPPQHQQTTGSLDQQESSSGERQHLQHRRLKDLTMGQAITVAPAAASSQGHLLNNPSTQEYLALQQRKATVNQLRGTTNSEQEELYCCPRSQSQTLKYYDDRRYNDKNEPMTGKDGDSIEHAQASSVDQSSDELCSKQPSSSMAKKRQQQRRENSKLAGGAQSDLYAQSVTEWKQVPITHMASNSIDSYKGANSNKRIAANRIRAHSKSGSLLKTALTGSEQDKVSQVNFEDGVFGQSIPMFSTEQRGTPENGRTDFEGQQQTSEFDSQQQNSPKSNARTKNGGVATTKTKKTLFGNYFAREFLQKRSDLQFGTGSVNKNILQQQLFTAVHRPQQFSRERQSNGFVFNKDLPATLITHESGSIAAESQISQKHHQSQQQQQQQQVMPTNSTANNIMINTGPVTSHTVMLNLFPATAKGRPTKNLMAAGPKGDSKHSKSKASVKEDVKKLKRTYGQNSTISSRHFQSQLRRDSSGPKIKLGSTVISSATSKDRAHKFKAQKIESEAQYTQLKFPLSNRRLEAIAKPSTKTVYGSLTQTPRQICSKAGTACGQREENCQSQLKIEPAKLGAGQRKFFRATESQANERDDEVDNLDEQKKEPLKQQKSLTIYQLQSMRKNTVDASTQENNFTTLYKKKDNGSEKATPASKGPQNFRFVSSGIAKSSKVSPQKKSKKLQMSHQSSIGKEEQLTQMGDFGPKMEAFSHIEGSQASRKTSLSRQKVNVMEFSLRQPVNLKVPKKRGSMHKSASKEIACPLNSTTSVKEQKAVLGELKTLVADSAEQLKCIQLKSRQPGGQNDPESKKRGSNQEGVSLGNNSTIVQVAMQRLIQMQQEYIKALELHQGYVEDHYDSYLPGQRQQKPQIQTLSIRDHQQEFFATSLVLNATLDKLAVLNREGYEQLAELQTQGDLPTENSLEVAVPKVPEAMSRHSSLETLGENCQSLESKDD